MKTTNALTAVLLFATTLLFGAERRISKSELPLPVQKAAEEQSAGARVRGYAKDTENGQVEYEVQLMINGHTKDVTMDPEGKLIEVEEQVQLDAIAPGVRKGLTERAGGGMIVKVESLTKRGSIVAYEAQVMTGGKHSEIQVGPDGGKLDHEE